jgi:phage N-6-adenine-methyltransferase
MTLVGFTPRNHPQQKVRDIVDDRHTPRALFDPLNAEHAFTLDAAASAENALCEKYFTRETDGLLRSWANEVVWCNPPFSRLEAWVAKVWREMCGGGKIGCHARPGESVRATVVATLC